MYPCHFDHKEGNTCSEVPIQFGGGSLEKQSSNYYPSTHLHFLRRPVDQRKFLPGHISVRLLFFDASTEAMGSSGTIAKGLVSKSSYVPIHSKKGFFKIKLDTENCYKIYYMKCNEFASRPEGFRTTC